MIDLIIEEAQGINISTKVQEMIRNLIMLIIIPPKNKNKIEDIAINSFNNRDIKMIYLNLEIVKTALIKIKGS